MSHISPFCFFKTGVIPIRPPVLLSVRPFVHLLAHVSSRLSFHPYFCLSVYPLIISDALQSFSLPVGPSICSSTRPLVSLFVRPVTSPSVIVFPIRQSSYHYIHPSVSLSFIPPARACIRPSMYPSVRLPERILGRRPPYLITQPLGTGLSPCEVI